MFKKILIRNERWIDLIFLIFQKLQATGVIHTSRLQSTFIKFVNTKGTQTKSMEYDRHLKEQINSHVHAWNQWISTLRFTISNTIFQANIKNIFKKIGLKQQRQFDLLCFELSTIWQVMKIIYTLHSLILQINSF